MTIYYQDDWVALHGGDLGALSHGDERLALHRDGDLIHWEAAWRGSSTGPPRRASRKTATSAATNSTGDGSAPICLSTP